MTKPRLTAADFPREVLSLFDQYVHGAIDRRGFIGQCAAIVGSVGAASATLALLKPDFARAQVVDPGDPRIAISKVSIPRRRDRARSTLMSPRLPTLRPRPGSRRCW